MSRDITAADKLIDLSILLILVSCHFKGAVVDSNKKDQ